MSFWSWWTVLHFAINLFLWKILQRNLVTRVRSQTKIKVDECICIALHKFNIAKKLGTILKLRITFINAAATRPLCTWAMCRRALQMHEFASVARVQINCDATLIWTAFSTFSAAVITTFQVPKSSQNADALRLKSHAYDRHYVWNGAENAVETELKMLLKVRQIAWIDTLRWCLQHMSAMGHNCLCMQCKCRLFKACAICNTCVM